MKTLPDDFRLALETRARAAHAELAAVTLEAERAAPASYGFRWTLSPSGTLSVQARPRLAATREEPSVIQGRELPLAEYEGKP